MRSESPLLLDIAGRRVAVSLALWDAERSRWVTLWLQASASGWSGANALGGVRLEMNQRGQGWDYRLELQGNQPTRARLQLELTAGERAYHLMPGVCHGDNSVAHDVEGRYPHLADSGSGPNTAPSWEFRADRCTHPISLMLLDDALVGVSIDPYCDDAEGPDVDGDVCNGVAATAAGSGRHAACAVTLSYRNLPATYVCQDRFGPPTGLCIERGKAGGRIYIQPTATRLDVHDVIRTEYEQLAPWRDNRNGESADGWKDVDRAIQAVRWGIAEVAWDEQRQTISNMTWDHERGRFADDSPHGFHEIAWTAGSVAAFPLLVSGLSSNDQMAVTRARMIFDRIADAVNPASGLFHDAVDRHGNAVEGWWSFYGLVPWEHYAYLNGQAATYMLHAGEADPAAPRRDDWLWAAISVLEHIVALQQSDGTLPWCVGRTDGRPIDYDGFASCWFVPALALAHRATGRGDLLESASLAFQRYARDVAAVHCYGTPLDTFKAVDQEGILAFIRAARLLHEITGDDAYLDWLGDGLKYEYLWRYGYTARPPADPLRSAPWSSAGGSITSVANPHIHPMGTMVMGDAAYYVDRRGDEYDRHRLIEQRDWAMQSLALYPTHAGFGHYGTMSERMCPSDGLVIEQHPEGRPWALWFMHHAWGAANILEGLLAMTHMELPTR